MPRPCQGLEGLVNGSCKNRKRGCASSSSLSSSMLQNFKLKQAVLIGRRCGTTTPVPEWKVEWDSPPSTSEVSELPQLVLLNPGRKEKEGLVSARKLGNVLWELNEIPLPQTSDDLQGRRHKGESRGRCRIQRSKQSRSIPSKLSDPSHSPASDIMDRPASSSHRKKLPQIISHKSRFNDLNDGSLNSPSYESSIEADFRSQRLTPALASSRAKVNTHLKNLNHNLYTAVELVEALGHIVGNKEYNSSIRSIVSALRVELDMAFRHVKLLKEEQRLEVGHRGYLKQFVEEKCSSERREKERIELAIQSIMEKFKLERESRRKMEKAYKNLFEESCGIKSALSNANKEIENERRLRELAEHVCNELARGIGEDKEEVEETRTETTKFREELEKEREMLQLADIWREERVQMKLSEAKFQLEEKNAVVDQLRNELETYLASKRSKENSITCRSNDDDVDAENIRKRWMSNMNADGTQREEKEQDCDDGGSEIDSVDSDLHSIELNMDSYKKGYNWNYPGEDSHQSTNSTANNEGDNEMGMSNEKTSARNHSLDRNISVESEPHYRISQHSELESGIEEVIDTCKDNPADKQSQPLDSDPKRYKSVKGLKEKMLISTSKVKRGLSSPTRPWIQPHDLAYSAEQVHVGSKVTEILRAMGGIGAKVGKTGSKTGIYSYRKKPLHVLNMEKDA